MLLQRFGAIFNNISGSKMPIWKRNSMPQANNMDAKHCAGQTLMLDFQWKRYLEGLFDWFSCQKFAPELHFNFCVHQFKLCVAYSWLDIPVSGGIATLCQKWNFHVPAWRVCWSWYHCWLPFCCFYFCNFFLNTNKVPCGLSSVYWDRLSSKGGSSEGKGPRLVCSLHCP